MHSHIATYEPRTSSCFDIYLISSRTFTAPENYSPEIPLF